MRRSIVYMAWGDDFVRKAAESIEQSTLPDYPVYLVTDEESSTASLPSGIHVIRRRMRTRGKLAKIDLLASLPEDLETVLFLDVDTRVIADVSLGFDKAEIHGMAMAAAPHYSLEHFRNFGTVMDREGVRRQGQLVYNSGVIFFASHDARVRAVFARAIEISERDESAPWGDQTYLTLAMEMLAFNPYTLSISFNHRAFGELISGSVRIWHSYSPVVEGAASLAPGFLYRYEDGKLVPAMPVPLS